MKIKRVIVLLLVVTFLTGCGINTAEKNGTSVYESEYGSEVFNSGE